jgi:hypothetical protein
MVLTDIHCLPRQIAEILDHNPPTSPSVPGYTRTRTFTATRLSPVPPAVPLASFIHLCTQLTRRKLIKRRVANTQGVAAPQASRAKIFATTAETGRQLRQTGIAEAGRNQSRSRVEDSRLAIRFGQPQWRPTRWRTDHPGNAAVAHQAGVQTCRPRRATGPRRARARPTPHLRHRTRRL